MTTPHCVLCGRPEDEDTPSFSWYLSSVGDSRCPECGAPQGADLVDRAEVEGELADLRIAYAELALDNARSMREASEEIAKMRQERNQALDAARQLRSALADLTPPHATKEEDENPLPMWGVELRNGRWLDAATMKAGHGTSTSRDKAHRFKTKREAEMEAEEWSFAGAMAKCLDDDKGTP
jgi:hypothetical protein